MGRCLRARGPIRDRVVAVSLGALLVGLAAACSGEGSSSRLPVAPAAPAPIPTAAEANYVGDAVVLSRIGSGGCGWGTAMGETRSGVSWSVERTSTDSISLDEDMESWPTDHIPFEGKLQGLVFVAFSWQGDDYLDSVCQFREATLTGTFADDFGEFEARETLIWGPPANETIVVRSWRVRRF